MGHVEDVLPRVMACAECRTVELQQIALEPGLPAYACPACEGIWIASTHYWEWLDKHGPTLPEKPACAAPPLPVVETRRAKICPGCGHILIKYRVGHDITFSLDQCGHCNSFWFDKNEWQVLKSRNLHDEVHKMFTAPWQRRIREEESRRTWQQIYTERFGEQDYADIRRIKAWIDQHPERQSLLAYLVSENPYTSW
jgi:Zn-finger nucleic acid-binding protein